MRTGAYRGFWEEHSSMMEVNRLERPLENSKTKQGKVDFQLSTRRSFMKEKKNCL